MIAQKRYGKKSAGVFSRFWAHTMNGKTYGKEVNDLKIFQQNKCRYLYVKFFIKRKYTAMAMYFL
ncbi:hypothetical protein HMPREF1633_02755 [Tissierellia bacterium S5-A11]|nr:hypothetical protein HMPREF1633_02755 [Tissierellia bacterium S5-A11]